MSLAQMFYYKSAKRRKENKTIAVIYLYLYFNCYLCKTTAVVSSANENFNNYLDSYSSKFNQDNILDVFTSNSSFHHHSKRYQKVRKKTLEDYERLPDNHINTNSVENIPPDHEFQSNNDVETLYVGYPKNPFGPSSRWNEKYTTNHEPLNEIISTDSSFNTEHDHNRAVETRGKRGVTHLYNMVSCATGCNPLSYKGYGCYCGFLGSGRITDRIDRCCMMHDVCYASVNCPVFLVYFMPYLWKCWRGRPLCAIDHLSYGRAGGCAARLCECDRELAMCLSHSPCPNRRALCTSSPWRLLQNIVMNV